MGLNALNTTEIIEVMENFVDKKRPPEHIRHKLDLSYRIENQSVFIYEIRPSWNDPEEIMHSDIAKATYVKVKSN